MKQQLAELETQLEQMGRTKRLAVHLVLLASALYMSWVLFGEALSEEIVTQEDRIASLEMKLLKNNNRSLEAAILKSKKEALALEDSINHLHFQKQFLQTKLQSIDFIHFSNQGSAELLDDILRHSVEHSIVLEQIVATPIEPQQEGVGLKPKNRLIVTGTGSFADITSLQYYIDSLSAVLVSDALHVSIDENNATRFELVLVHYGVDL
ncbi:MAG: hypothetical protein JXK05_06685 [Campylobacterales bacterium]|nr:hypothetical protein [Campylobacterales bacterium]